MIRPALFLGMIVAAVIAYRVYTAPKPKQVRLAPDGIYYLSQYVSLRTPRGVVGFAAGEMMRRASGAASPGMVKVTDGNYVIEVAESKLTNDLDLAESIAAGERETQRLLGENTAKAEALAWQEQNILNSNHSRDVATYDARTRGAAAVGNLSTPLNARASYVNRGGYEGGYRGGYYGGVVVTNGASSSNQAYINPPKWSAPKRD